MDQKEEEGSTEWGVNETRQYTMRVNESTRLKTPKEWEKRRWSIILMRGIQEEEEEVQEEVKNTSPHDEGTVNDEFKRVSTYIDSRS